MSYLRYSINSTDKINSESENSSYHFLYFSHITYDDSMNPALHCHGNSEILYITKGKGLLETSDETLEINKGDLVIINPNEMHAERIHPSNNDTFEFYVLGLNNILFINSFKSKESKNIMVHHFDAQNVPLNFSNIIDKNNFHSYTLELYENVIFELNSTPYNFIQMVQNLFSAYLITLSRITKVETLFQKTQLQSKKSNEINFIKQYIDNNFSLEICLDDLAKKIFISKSYLLKLFKSQTGLSPMQYIKRKRLDEAKCLLTNTDLAINQVVQYIGYSNSANFFLDFKKYTTLSPSEYRLFYIQK